MIAYFFSLLAMADLTSLSYKQDFPDFLKCYVFLTLSAELRSVICERIFKSIHARKC